MTCPSLLAQRGQNCDNQVFISVRPNRRPPVQLLVNNYRTEPNSDPLRVHFISQAGRVAQNLRL